MHYEEYRPISNLSVLSKLLERIVVRQLMTYLTDADLFPPLQSGFRPGHSTESAVLCVLSDILLAVDRGDFAALVLLDLSAAFDTVDHDILLQRLKSSFGIADVARDRFRLYLSAEGNSSVAVTYGRLPFPRFAAFLKARCSGQFCSSCMSPTWPRWLRAMV